MKCRGTARWIKDGVVEYEGDARADVVMESLVVSGVSLKLVTHATDYSAVLKPSQAGGVFTGMWVLNPSYRGPCVARLYGCLDGNIILHGSWSEDGKQYEWLTELKPE